MSPPYRLHATGDWGEAQVRCTVRPGRHRLPAELMPQVAAAWAAACARPGVTLFDGAMLRLESWRADGDGLELVLRETGYQDFLGSNAAHPEWGDVYGPHALSSPLGTSAALLSADGRLVFGVRSAAVALYPGHAHPFGGTLEPAAGGAVFAELLRELAEEVHVGAADLDGLRAIALVEDLGLRQVELVFLARCRLALADIAARLDPAEHGALWSVPADADGLDATLDAGQAMTAVTRATLVAAGARLAGPGWAGRRLAADLARGVRR